jgi:hypothetical protein
MYARREPGARQQLRSVSYGRRCACTHCVGEERRVRIQVRLEGANAILLLLSLIHVPPVVRALHLREEPQRSAEVFFAWTAPAFFARTVQQQVPLPALYRAPSILQRA